MTEPPTWPWIYKSASGHTYDCRTIEEGKLSVMTDWLDPEQVKAWLNRPRKAPEHPLHEFATHQFDKKCRGCEIDIREALEQFVRAFADIDRFHGVDVVEIRAAARLIVEALEE